MRVLLLGKGIIGAAVEKELSLRHEVVALTRNTSPSVDITDEEALLNLFSTEKKFDAVINCIGHVPFGAFDKLSAGDYLTGFYGKVLPQINLSRIAADYLNNNGSVTLTTGILARYPIAGATAASMANGAIESFVMATAPVMPRGIRLNVVSPSLLEEATNFYAAFPGVIPVSSHRVARAYAQAVEGIETGKTFIVE